MDALAVFADPENWEIDDEEMTFTFSYETIADPIEFARKVIESLRKKTL